MSDKPPSSPRRLWIVIIVLIVFLLITAGLLVTTLDVRDQAVNGQMTAQAQIDVAATAQFQAQDNAAALRVQLLRSDTQRLGAMALSLSNADDAELAALLSLRSLAQGYSANADLALAQSLAQLNGTTVQGNQVHIFSAAAAIDHAVFSPDGKLIIGHTGDTLKWWDVYSGQEVRSVAIEGNVVDFSADHTMFLTTTADPGGQGWTVHLYETENGTEVQHVTSPTKYQVNAHLLTGDKLLITTGSDSPDKLYPVMQLWNAQTGQEIKRFTNNEDDAYLSHDGKYLITAGKFGMIRLDASTLTEIRKLESDSEEFALFSRDNHYMITGSEDKTIILVVADTGHEIGRFGDGSAPADFSPDSSLLVMTGETKLHLMDLQTGQERSYLDDATGPAVFSPSSALLAASISDNTAHLVDTKNGAEVRVLTGHTGPIDSLDYSPNGQYILTTSQDGTARLWRADYHLAMAQACQRLSRDLTDAERRKYDIPDNAPTCTDQTAPF